MEELQEKKRIDIAKLKKTGAVVLPSIFTIANMAFGFFAILLASEGRFTQAAWFIVASYFMDMLDGRVARLVHGESSFGVEIDSLSDWMSFCTGVIRKSRFLRATQTDGKLIIEDLSDHR